MTAAAICLGAVEATGQRTPDDVAPAVAGWVETVWFPDYSLSIDAKMDTGADSSSLHAGEFHIFSRDGQRWVQFPVAGRDGSSRTVETQVIRTARIRRAGARVIERPVVALNLCVAGKTGQAEITLADRSGMDFQMLIGRQFMASRVAIDPGRRFAGSGKCVNGAQAR